MDDTNTPGSCPSCGKRGASTLRCDDCPVNTLDHLRSTTAAGRLLERALDLEFDTGKFKIDWDDVDCELREALRILVHERAVREQELFKRRDEESEERRRVEEAQARTRGQH